MMRTETMVVLHLNILGTANNSNKALINNNDHTYQIENRIMNQNRNSANRESNQESLSFNTNYKK